MPKHSNNHDKIKENKEIRELKKRIKKLKEEKSSMKRAILRKNKQLSKMTPQEPVEDLEVLLDEEDIDRIVCPECGRMAEKVLVGVYDFCKCSKCGCFKKILNKNE